MAITYTDIEAAYRNLLLQALRKTMDAGLDEYDRRRRQAVVDTPR